MKKFLTFILALALASMQLPVFAASTYKYEVRIVDQFDEPIASDATVRVKTVDTNTDASIWPSDDTETGTLTGAVTPDSNGIARFYSTATSHDVIVHYRGKVYAYEGITPGKDRRVQVEKFDAAIDLDTDSVALSTNTITVPLKGNLFRVTGTGQFRTITDTGHQIGKRLTLIFAAAAGTDAPIHSDGNIVPRISEGTIQRVGAGSAIQVVWDGSKWRVIG